jgi:hypothetical protein
MKYNLELLKADILDELEKIQRLEREFSFVEDKLGKSDKEIRFYDRGAIGYYLHNFYNGCENIFRCIARFFENDVGPQTWHSDLLKRMKLNVPGYRPAVIDDDLYLLLDDFRGFRHKFRHVYGFEIDWERLRLVAKKFLRTSELFRKQLEYFVQHLNRIEE